MNAFDNNLQAFDRVNYKKFLVLLVFFCCGFKVFLELNGSNLTTLCPIPLKYTLVCHRVVIVDHSIINICINDIAKILHFADDLKICLNINFCFACLKLQFDLTNLVACFKRNSVFLIQINNYIINDQFNRNCSELIAHNCCIKKFSFYVILYLLGCFFIHEFNLTALRNRKKLPMVESLPLSFFANDISCPDKLDQTDFRISNSVTRNRNMIFSVKWNIRNYSYCSCISIMLRLADDSTLNFFDASLTRFKTSLTFHVINSLAPLGLFFINLCFLYVLMLLFVKF